NFMKTRVVNMELYPAFSPLIAKYGGNAKVFTRAELRRFYWHYFRKSPSGVTRHFLEQYWRYSLEPGIQRLLRSLGLFDLVKSGVNQIRDKGLSRIIR